MYPLPWSECPEIPSAFNETVTVSISNQTLSDVAECDVSTIRVEQCKNNKTHAAKKGGKDKNTKTGSWVIIRKAPKMKRYFYTRGRG